MWLDTNEMRSDKEVCEQNITSIGLLTFSHFIDWLCFLISVPTIGNEGTRWPRHGASSSLQQAKNSAFSPPTNQTLDWVKWHYALVKYGSNLSPLERKFDHRYRRFIRFSYRLDCTVMTDDEVPAQRAHITKTRGEDDSML